MIRVILPTHNRPHFLATALESIRTQVNRDAISSVVVSENSDDSGSRSICEAFQDLPIEYIHRQPPVPVLEHFRLLFLDSITEPYTAFLCDDDWWADNHLAESLAAIDSRPGSSACYSNIFETHGPQFPAAISEKAVRVWLATGTDFSPSVINMDFASVIAANLIEATFHYTTLVARTPALQFAMAETLKTNNPYDNDRVAPIFLAQQGQVAFRTKPSAWIRFHPNQDSERDDYREHNNDLKAATTCWIRDRWPQDHHEAVRRLNKTLATLEPAWVDRISNMCGGAQRKTLVSQSGIHLNLPAADGQRRGLRWLLKQLLPHGAVMAYHASSSRTARCKS